MLRKITLIFLFALPLVPALSACSPANSPAQAVESYLAAVVAKDPIQTINLSCTAWELQAQSEGAAYEGVQAVLQEPGCQVIAEDGERATVSCSGHIQFSYAGGENQIDQLSGRLFEVALEGDEWKMCGVAYPEAVAAAPDSESSGEASPASIPNADRPTEPAASEEPPASEPTPITIPAPPPPTEGQLTPHQWRSWPILPSLHSWLYEIYAIGQQFGNDNNAFSKVGDCQNIPAVFLGIYDKEDRYFLSEDSTYLQSTVDHFRGSWGRDNISVDGGFNFPAVFSPLRADPDICLPGENPLACEIRVHKPIFIIISMEYVYTGRTADNYETFLRDAVDYALSQGVIPILATKADNAEGDHSLNLATAQVAYEYSLPLWNFWAVAQKLPDKGIDWERDTTGFYITVQGWNARNISALKVLDALWRQLVEENIAVES
jgi:hypothetical protein